MHGRPPRSTSNFLHPVSRIVHRIVAADPTLNEEVPAEFELQPYHDHRVSRAGPTNNEQRRRSKRLAKLESLAEREEMKFSHSIQFNAVPDWSSHYIAYSNLKKSIYTLEKQINASGGGADGVGADEEAALLGGQQLDPDTTFKRLLDNELDKVCSFYRLKEIEVYGEMETLLGETEQFVQETKDIDMEEMIDLDNNRRHVGRSASVFASLPFKRRRRASTLSASLEVPEEEPDDSDSDVDDRAAMIKKPDKHHDRTITGRPRSKSAWQAPVTRTDSHSMTSSNEDIRTSQLEDSTVLRRRRMSELDVMDQSQISHLFDSGINIKKRIINTYVSLCELKSFIQLNQTGFKKASKKYDKVCDRDIRKSYMEKQVSPAYPFRDTTMAQLDQHIEKIEQAYADVVTKGNVSLAKRELRLHLREHVVWERNTVWREMIGIERKAQAANFGIRQTLLGGTQNASNTRLQGDRDEVGTKELHTPVGRYTCPKWLVSPTFFALVAIVAVFFVLLFVPIMAQPEQQNCLAMLVLVSLLWATEVIPLFVTSLLIPFLVVVLGILRSEDEPHGRLNPKEATGVIFAAMWTSTIMLLLGGFTIAAALSKYHIAKMMATFVLSKAGTRARNVLVTNMFVAMFLSMWISNVAAPVLCFGIIQPILRNLPADSDMTKALLLGIALASNIGGAASPIASPQNIIALQNMKPAPSWGIWFFIALPVCVLTILCIWVLLLVTFKPGRGTTIVPIRPMKDKLNGVQYFIIAVTLATIALWCASHQLEPYLGDMGVIAIIPLVLFFGTGILTKEDFNNFLWTIIILAAGGLSLGKAVSSSGLLHTVAQSISDGVAGFSVYVVLVVFAGLILVVATFISHTVAALIVLPLVADVGKGMAEPHPNLLVMGAALMCSAAMGLPTSGFPNMTAIMMERPETGQRYLQVKHFLTRGVPSSIIAFAIVITLGYGLMLAAGL